MLLVNVYCGRRFSSHLFLFLDCPISNSICIYLYLYSICIIVSASFLICLFVFITFRVSKCCCGV